jgi:hypothetical protein
MGLFLVEIGILLIAVVMLIWVLYTIVGTYYGAPWVPTPKKYLVNIFQTANLKPGEIFCDLGSGDGIVVKTAMKTFGVRGFGVEINPLLTTYANFRGVKTIRKNLFDVDLSRADVIYLYMGSEVGEKVANKLDKEGKKGVRVISRRFEIKSWRKNLLKKIPDGKNWTYFYRL